MLESSTNFIEVNGISGDRYRDVILCSISWTQFGDTTKTSYNKRLMPAASGRPVEWQQVKEIEKENNNKFDYMGYSLVTRRESGATCS